MRYLGNRPIHGTGYWLIPLSLFVVASGIVIGSTGFDAFPALLAAAAFPLMLLMGRWQPQALLAVFLTAGSYSIGSSPPVDTGYYFLAVLGLVCVTSFRRGSGNLKWQAWVLLIMVLLLMFTFLYGGRTSYAWDKFLRLGFSVPVCVMAVHQFLRTEDDLERFISWIALIGVVLCAYALVLNPASLGSGRLETFGGSPITLGRIAGLTVISAISLSVGKRPRLWLTLPSGLFGATAVVYSGSRGPLLALGFSVAVLVVLQVLSGRLRLKTVAGTGMTGAAFFLLLTSGGAGLAVSRLMLLLESDPGGSASTRAMLFRMAMTELERHPVLGIGLGSFADVAYGGIRYPHNLLLEVGAEGGVIALGLLLLFLVGSTAPALHRVIASWSGVSYFIMAGILFTFVNSLVSGDINNNYILFTLALSGAVIADQGRLRSAHGGKVHPVHGGVDL